jgi:hypothetical protein
VALALLAVLRAASADDTISSKWDIDAAERELELWRHERLLARRAEPDADLGPFATDGCSGGLSAAWGYAAGLAPKLARIHGEQPPWEACCVDHDRAYHAGGVPPGNTPADALASYEARRDADLALKACVLASRETRTPILAESYGLDEAQQEALYEVIAEFMYRAVRLGGMPCTSLPWRWGYGWPECR